MNKNILRFAPSPTGYLHIGNARTAIFNFLLAKKNDGEFILRLDDTDRERSKQYFIDEIKHDLEWLGICWDRVEQQSTRLERYFQILNNFIKDKSDYECFETSVELDLKRKKQLNSGRPPVYDRQSLSLSEVDKEDLRKKEGSYWRFLLSGDKVEWEDKIAGKVEVQTNSVSDPVLIKANSQFLYTMASVIDDMDFKITDVVRGVDHLTNTAVQIEIFNRLTNNHPGFAHHSLIVDPAGNNFSKRTNSLSIKDLRENGVEPGAICSILVNLGSGQKLDVNNDLHAFAKDFDLAKFNTSPTKFNKEDLLSVSRKALSKLKTNDISNVLSDLGVPDQDLESFWNMAKDNIDTREELKSLWKMCQEGGGSIILPEDQDICPFPSSLSCFHGPLYSIQSKP